MSTNVLAFRPPATAAPVPVEGAPRMPADVWRELGESMRRVRQAHGLSLRQVEAMSGWGRGTLSQVENGKARPGLGLVEWYEHTLHADGLLIGLYTGARAAHAGVGRRRPAFPDYYVAGDAMEVAAASVPSGLQVAADERLSIGWTIRNTGTVRWRGRQLRRTGAYAGSRLISSSQVVDVPETPPGRTAEVAVPVVAPRAPGTVVAYWRMVDHRGRYCFPAGVDLSAILVVV